MDNLHELTKEFISKELKEMDSNQSLEKKEIKILSYYYGIDCERLSLKEIARRLNIKIKNIKEEVSEAERQFFNVLKKKI